LIDIACAVGHSAHDTHLHTYTYTHTYTHKKYLTSSTPSHSCMACVGVHSVVRMWVGLWVRGETGRADDYDPMARARVYTPSHSTLLPIPLNCT